MTTEPGITQFGILQTTGFYPEITIFSEVGDRFTVMGRPEGGETVGVCPSGDPISEFSLAVEAADVLGDDVDQTVPVFRRIARVVGSD